MKRLEEMYFDAFFARVDQGELIPVPMPEEGPIMKCGSEEIEARCPKCGSEEIETSSPRTTYSCGSSDYDQRPETFQQSTLCKQRAKGVDGFPPFEMIEK
jgi:hypothetical protein